MKYYREIPRDFFNEAKLLNCLGLLSLKILDCQLPEGIGIEIEGEGQPFNIVLLKDGSLVVDNYPILLNGMYVKFKTTYNSKSNYPFFAEHKNCDIPVFDDNGEFDEEFINYFRISNFSSKNSFRFPCFNASNP